MAWTALVAEYFAIGVQVFAWVALLVLWVENTSPSNVVAWARDIPGTVAGALAVALLVLSYSVGMVFDKAMHSITQPCLKWLVRRYWKRYRDPADRPKSVGREFYGAEDALTSEGGEQARLFRRRGRIRVFRALLINVPATMVTIWLHYRALWIIVCGIVFFVMVAIAFWDAHRQYVRMIARKARLLKAPV
jgi:hypothetical protein